MKYSMMVVALAAAVAGCSSSATRDRLQIQNPTVLQNGFGTTQDQAAGAVTPQWIATYGGASNGSTLKDVQKRLNDLGAHKDNYFGYKAQCWLDAARAERAQRDGWGFVEEALHEAGRMTTALETSEGLDINNPDLRTTAAVRPDIWKQILAAKMSPDFPTCQAAQRLTACAEVGMMHAGHAAWTRNFEASQRIAAEVESGLPAIGAAFDACHVAPPPPLAARIPDKVTLQADAIFRFDQADLAGMLPAGRAKLDRLVADLKTVDDVTAIRIAGHADRLGDDQYNRLLSIRRAETVMRYLQDSGVTVPITAHGYGRSRPVVVCDERDHRALIDCLEPNRRVELDFERSTRAAAVSPVPSRTSTN